MVWLGDFEEPSDSDPERQTIRPVPPPSTRQTVKEIFALVKYLFAVFLGSSGVDKSRRELEEHSFFLDFSTMKVIGSQT